MRIAFFGTPDFAVPCLEALLRSKRHTVIAAVTQPDKPKGRGQEKSESAVKAAANAAGIQVLQPSSVKNPPFAPELARLSPDLAVVVAYGKILPPDLLAVPRRGCINVHGSILPRWRGAAPIQWAVLAGDSVSGVTTMQMDEGMDTGDMLLQREVPLRADETAGSLFERLAPVGAELLLETLAALEAGTLVRRKQDPALATHARMLTKEDGRVAWTRSSAEIERQVRGTSPWPGAFTTFGGGKILKLHRVRGVTDPGEKALPPATILHMNETERPLQSDVGKAGGACLVQCGTGQLLLLEVQPEGGKRMTAAEFFRGRGASLKALGEAAP